MIFIDSGVLYAYMNKEDKDHNKTLEIMRLALSGMYGRIVISNYITDESLTLARVRTGNCQCSRDILQFIKEKKGSTNILLEIIIEREIIKSTEGLFEKFCEKGLSFTDCSILAIIETMQIEYLASFDKGFKGLVKNQLGVN